MAGVIITAIMIALGNLVADLLYGVNRSPYHRAKSIPPAANSKKEAAARACTSDPHRPPSEGRERSLWTDAWRRMRRSHTAVIGMILFCADVIVCFAPRFFSD